MPLLNWFEDIYVGRPVRNGMFYKFTDKLFNPFSPKVELLKKNLQVVCFLSKTDEKNFFFLEKFFFSTFLVKNVNVHSQWTLSRTGAVSQRASH